MPSGLQVFDPATNKLMLDLTMNHCRFYGYIDVSANGSRVIPDMSKGPNPFYVVVPKASLGTKGKRPTVEFSGSGNTTMTWNYSFYNGNGNYAVPCRIYYGVY